MSTQNDHIDFDLIAKYLAGEAAASEVQDLEKRMEADADFQKEVHAMRSLWDAAGDAVIEVDAEAGWEKVSSSIGAEVLSIDRPSRANRSWLLAVAAAVVLAVAIPSVLWLTQNSIEMMTLESGGAMASLDLSDGSHVSLQEGSSIHYPDRFESDQREVWLDGVGFFEISADKEHPFIVHTSHGDVRVVGTAFEVDTRMVEEGILVEVQEGIVEVSDSKTNLNQRVEAGEAVKLSTKTQTIEFTEHLEPDAFFWKDRTIRFKKTELEQVIKTLEDAYGVQIALGSENIAGCELTATFKDETIESILDIISTTLRLELTEIDGDYTLSGEGC
ncbi:MAG: FecR domain-containing protein [Flavobacteriales bacterium]|nr:FecR domain-containing protein [Flavobacteriales bacterium]